MTFYEQRGEDLILTVRVVPRASRDEIVGPLGHSLKVRIQAPPLEGRANAHLIGYLARLWKIPKSRIKCLSGEKSRNKRISITAPDAELYQKLKALEE